MSSVKLTTTGGNGGTVELKGPANTTSNAAVQLTLPVNDGDADQYLKTDGSGTLSWATVAGGVDGISSSADANAITIDSSEHVIVGGTTVSGVHAGNQDFVVGNTSNTQTGMALNCASGGYISIVMSDGEGDKNKGLIAYNHADDTFKLVNNPASGYDTLVLESDHDVVVARGNLVIGTNAKGIDFSSNSADGAGMTSELLDSYEEGTWTPAWNTGSASTAMMSAAAYETSTSGNYVKIGRLVTFTCNIECSSHTARSSCETILTGLPFTCENVYKTGGATFSIAKAVDSGNTGDVPTVQLHPGGSYMKFYYTNGSLYESDDNQASWNDQLTLHGHYFTQY